MVQQPSPKVTTIVPLPPRQDWRGEQSLSSLDLLPLLATPWLLSPWQELFLTPASGSRETTLRGTGHLLGHLNTLMVGGGCHQMAQSHRAQKERGPGSRVGQRSCPGHRQGLHVVSSTGAGQVDREHGGRVTPDWLVLVLHRSGAN
jgi:hypothetical protein